MQDQDIENAFQNGPSSQHEIAMKGVGTFRIEEPESVRLLARRQRVQVYGSLPIIIELIYNLSPELAKVILYWTLHSS